MGWDFYGNGTNLTWRRIFENFGLIGQNEPMPAGGDEGYMRAIYARATINVDTVIAAMDLFPGDHSGDHAREILSEDVSAAESGQAERTFDEERYLRYREDVRAIVEREFDETLAFWRDHVGLQGLREGKDPASTFEDAFERYVSVQTNHSANSTLCQQYFSQATRLAERAGLGELASSLTTGIGDTFDTRSMARLWQVSRGKATLEDYLGEFGFQTSTGDDLSGHSWRENPASLRALVGNYQKMDESSSPFAHEHERVEQRQALEERIIAALPVDEQGEARKLFDLLASSTRVRELGKASYRIALDVARAAARAQGAVLHKQGRIDGPEDIFLLVRTEAFGDAEDLRGIVAERKAILELYATYDIPQAWTGDLEPALIEALADDGGVVSGLGVSAGVIEGTVRLILDHSSAEDMEPGEILVTNTTDPSWGPFFVAAGALVIDVGGAMSHGAIIARELGIPCVINTKNGTRRLKDGMTVRVDGNTGTVEVLH
ncbi:MAG: hypothetical protein CFE35_12675 [Novosphingobium sp. PASSN1]|nr:MAG: hypothetical protein CFE35_12675 [Novosphingobium sp. PASSN1]